MIDDFTPAAPIEAAVIERFAPIAPAGAVEMWREHGTGWFSQGFFRIVDPAHAEEMLEGVYRLPPDSVVLFTTALADLVMWSDGFFYLLKWRWGVLEILPREGSLETVLEWMHDPELLEKYFSWLPYPEAAARDGVPALEECFGYVPLLALGGPSTADRLQRMGLWEHIAIILQLAGKPRIGGEFAPPGV